MASKVLSIEDQPFASRVGTPSVEAQNTLASPTSDQQYPPRASPGLRDQQPIEMHEKTYQDRGTEQSQLQQRQAMAH